MGDTRRRAQRRHSRSRRLMPTLFTLLAATITVACASDQTSSGRAASTRTSLAQQDPSAASASATTATASTSTTQATVESEPSQTPTTMLPGNPPETGAPTSTQFLPGLTHEWVRRNWQLAEFVATRDGIRFVMDHGERGLSDLLDQCVTVASDLAVRSSTDAVLADQAQVFDDIAATCSSMGAAVSSGGATALAAGSLRSRGGTRPPL